MNKSHHKKAILLLVFVFSSSNIPNKLLAQEEQHQNRLSSQVPRYEVKLDMNEFSLLNSSIVDGINKYGGTIEFDLKIAKEENETGWTVTTGNRVLIEVLGQYIAEKSIGVLKSIDPENLNSNAKMAFKVVKSLAEKLEYTQKNPIWDIVKYSGRVFEENGLWFIKGAQGSYQIVGNKLEELRKINSRDIIAYGFVKVKDQIEITRFVERKDNTLEVFVMSSCPFAQQAEWSIINFLKDYSEKSKPTVEIHYILYEKKGNGHEIFTSLHGEEEVGEDLVQIVIRDVYSKFFYAYLLGRVRDPNIPWDKLSATIGLNHEEIVSIKHTIANERERLLQKEHDYVTGTYGIYDGSPAFVWEGEKTTDIGKVVAFKGLSISSAQDCSR
jgi:hypothetical protein